MLFLALSPGLFHMSLGDVCLQLVSIPISSLLPCSPRPRPLLRHKRTCTHRPILCVCRSGVLFSELAAHVGFTTPNSHKVHPFTDLAVLAEASLFGQEHFPVPSCCVAKSVKLVDCLTQLLAIVDPLFFQAPPPLSTGLWAWGLYFLWLLLKLVPFRHPFPSLSSYNTL